MNDLKINPIDTQKDEIYQKPLMKANVIPKFCSSIIINGKSGSGKSTLLGRLLTEDKFYGGYFDFVVLYSPTGDSDDVIKYLNLPEENVITNFDTAEEHLEKILEKQRKCIEDEGILKCPKLCIIFDDIVSNQKFLKSKIVLKLFCMCRHYACQVILNTQSWTKIPRACRLQANGIFFFPASMSEVELLAEEFSPPNMHKKDFIKLIQHATNERYNFLFINNFVHFDERFRKNLDTILKLKK